MPLTPPQDVSKSPAIGANSLNACDGPTLPAMIASFSSSAQSWDKLLTHQVTLFSPAEFRYLATLPEWATAESVVDVGCGNGDYVSRLRKEFPHKGYAGIDSSGELISIAKNRHSQTDIAFHIGDIIGRAPPENFDAIILRFVVQHLPDSLSFFKSLHRLAHSRSMVVVLEPSPSDCQAVPDLTKLSELVDRYDRFCKEVGHSRGKLQSSDGFKSVCGDTWHVVHHHAIQSCHERKTWIAKDLAQVFDGWLTALESSGAVDFEYEEVRQEVADWIATTGQSVSMKLNAWILRPA
jgi:trans-aconitate methyltransferase